MLSNVLSNLSSKLNRKDVCELCMEFCKKYDGFEDEAGKLSKFASTYSEDVGCSISIDFYNESAHLVDTVAFATFENDYKTLMRIILQTEFKTSRLVADDIIDNLGYGNWKHLWCSHEEAEQSAGQILNNLIGEIFYCSDRWSWDRVLRCNWLYLRLATEAHRFELWENWTHSTVYFQTLKDAEKEIEDKKQVTQNIESDTDQIVNQMLEDIYNEQDSTNTESDNDEFLFTGDSNQDNNQDIIDFD